MILTGLTAGTAHAYEVQAKDRNGNGSSESGAFTTVVRHLHVDSIELDVVQASPVVLEARFRVVDRTGAPVAGVPVHGRFAGDVGANPVAFVVETNAAGVATHTLSPYVPSGPDTVFVGLDFLGSTDASHPFFVGFGGGSSSFFYEQPANAMNYATADV